MRDIRAEGNRALTYARENGRRIMILAGRPYHIDPEMVMVSTGWLPPLALWC